MQGFRTVAPRRRLRRGLLVVAGVGAVCLALLGTQRGERAVPMPAVRGAGPPAGAADVATADPRGAPGGGSADVALAGGLGPRPRSLRGTKVDGALTTDADGHFVPTAAARRVFDYFLAASGEEPLATIRARIVAAIEQRLPPAAAREAIDLLDRYLAYRERARALAEGSEPVAADPAERLAAVQALRRETLGAADADALFADEEAMARFAIEQRRLAADTTLSPDERARRSAALEAELPAPLREARAAALAPTRLARAEAALRQSGASAEQIRALREQAVGTDAADRLAALDARRAEWQRRVEDYRAARAAIEQDPAQTPEARAQAIERLLAERFTPEERRRIEGLDRIAATGGDS